jgi:hypothetical protein
LTNFCGAAPLPLDDGKECQVGHAGKCALFHVPCNEAYLRARAACLGSKNGMPKLARRMGGPAGLTFPPWLPMRHR